MCALLCIFLHRKPFYTCAIMKKLKFLLAALAAVVSLAVPTAAQAQYLYNGNGSSVGQIRSDGSVYNSYSSRVGQIRSDGSLYNSYSQRVGKIESNGTVRNSYGSNIGRVESDGSVRNGYGQNIGKIYDDGTVRNGYGQNIGRARGVKKEWAAAFFFFNFFQ